MIIRFDGSTFYWYAKQDRSIGFTFVLRPDRLPKEIDEVSASGANHGIYELSEDRLLICSAEPEGAARPTAFKANESFKWNLTEWKRVVTSDISLEQFNSV